MICTHTDRPNVRPAHWNAHICRECWDANVQPLIDALPREPLKGNDYEYHGPMIYRGDGTIYREQRLK